ncbi:MULTISPECIES: hypothetical protein [Acetobacter]|uniref:Uncharacterized protein n=1 Tax=Acetobacter pomorum DM001 TaxID=945681 RepID=F1YRW1_9PROT|nr:MULTISPECIES: hypothetical protein [Acetobacter]ATI12306.1 hypothetical protein CPF11_07470 [Acetobacter pomorum]AXC27555.1 hypothetical protein DS739_12940 [Acetobacter sp. JWB]EGE48551.1 Hypothetical protein APO_0647 [Acetobacter pomorum DM001]KAA8423948.1 hypothetical protein FKW54_10745 [Acetobacter pomorum]KAA8438349.1 hypothetical protein FKW50_00530 [Acetobacter pomorum]
MAERAYTMPGTRWAVLTPARLHGDALAAFAAAGLSLLALAGFLHPEHLRRPSGGGASHTHHLSSPHTVLVASATYGAEPAR